MPIVNSSIDRRRFALTLAGTAALSTARGEESGAAKLWTEVPHWMELACLPGAVVAVIEKGSVAGVHAFGVRRDGEAGAVDAATIFEAASLSKPVFASAVLRLTAAKALDLDRPLDEILPLAADPRAKLITARHVLSHSSGLQNWRNPRNDIQLSVAGRSECSLAARLSRPADGAVQGQDRQADGGDRRGVEEAG